MYTTPIWLADAPPKPRGVLALASWWEVASATLVAGFLAAQFVLIATVANGPTLDEGIYLTAGHRTLEGYGMSDGYLAWFAGSLLWPVLAGLGDTVAGLQGARDLAAVFMTIAVAAVWRACVVLFGPRAGFFCVALAVTCGPVVGLGHLAVIDAPSIAGIAVAFWGVTELARRDHRGWLVVVAGAFSFGVLAKYPSAVCGVPLALLLILLRGRRAVMDLALWALVIAAVVITYFLSARHSLGYFLGWRVDNNPSFGITRDVVAFSQLWYAGLISLLAVGGWLVCRRKRLAGVLLLGGVLFPAYHVATANSVGDTKQVVFGLIFTLPLAGRLLEGLARWPNGVPLACMVALAAGLFGVVQVQRLDRTWMDVEPAVDYLATHARPGQQYLIDGAWPFTARLYEDGKISSPWVVYDLYRVEHRQNPTGLCHFDWFVRAPGGSSWPDRIRHRIRRCGTYRRVYRERAPVLAVGKGFSFFTWEGEIEIYRNVREART